MFNLLVTEGLKKVSSVRNLAFVAKTLTSFNASKPDIMVATGVVVGVASAALLAYNVAKYNQDLRDLAEKRKDIIDSTDQDDAESVQMAAEELRTVYIDMAKNVVTTYGPPVVTGAFAVYILLQGYGLLKERNNGLVAAVTLLQAGIQQYRQRVRDEVGAEDESRLFHNLATENIVTVVTGEDGKTLKVRSKENYIPEQYVPSMYAREFGPRNKTMFHPVRAINVKTLTGAEDHFSDKLKIDGVLILNKVYEFLDIPESPEGAVVGWVYDPLEDTRVSFGLHNPVNSEKRNNFLLDFNVSGVVYTQLKG